MGRAAVVLTMLTLLVPAIAPGVVRAETTILVNTVNQEINGDGFCSLQEAIYAANLDDNVAPDPSTPGQMVDTACPGGSGHDVIELPPASLFRFSDPIDDAANFMGPTATPIITSAITIEGRGARLERLVAGRLTRAFAVGATGSLDLREVHVKGFSIRGGEGGPGGGGGGMGAGGAIYVQAGSLLVQWSTFEANSVRGGDGGDANVDSVGGGGGLSGDGGGGFSSGGGGGGSRGDGADGDIVSGVARGGGGGGRLTSGVGRTPGQPCGGQGGESEYGILGDDGDDANPGPNVPCPGGGGGGGASTDTFDPGDGGDGSYGGGGGGGGSSPGISGGDGGIGGFGGGGGGAADSQGGHGGFGGGGGKGFQAFSEGRGQGGTFAGDGGDRAGGGGAGLGGAIFGYLADIEVINSTFAGNVADQGRSGIACGLDTCGPNANDGRGAGGAIFTVAGDLVVRSSTFAGNATGTVTGGGGGAIVVYDPIGDDEATLVLRNSIIAGNGEAECYTRNGVDTGGSSGNIVTDSSATNTPDSLACPGVAGSDDPGLGSLSDNPPGRTPTMAISAGSNAVDNAVGTSPLDDQRGVARPQGEAADIGAYELEVVDPPVDATPPVTTIALTPASPDGSNGWYKSQVGVAVTATDTEGTVAQTRCVLDPATTPTTFAELPDAACTLTSVGSDGDHAIHAASVDDVGNVEATLATVSFKVDRTAPTLDPSLSPASVVVGQTGVSAAPNATDATSGVASSSCGSVDATTPGVHTVDCTATDNAGNVGTATLTYVVEYRILGFFSPVPGSKWKVGQTVPIKVALADAQGVRIGDAEAAALASACRVTFAASGAQTVTSGPCLKYDPRSDQFVYNWKLGKRPTGQATVSVVVSYPETTVTTTRSVTIAITR